ncbi:MAG: class I SAM-dependent methyltransferase, partial [Candidatus Hydrothermarchaeaceae archaeon]
MDPCDARYEGIGDEAPTEGAKRFVKILAEDVKYILDVGCGHGQDSLYFASLGYQVTGIDPSKRAVEMALCSIKESMNVEFFQDDALRLPFPSENVDAIWSASLICLLSRDEMIKAAGEMARVLKPGGVLGLYVSSSRDGEEECSDKSKKARSKFDKGGLEKILSDFHIIALEELKEEEGHADGGLHHQI